MINQLYYVNLPHLLLAKIISLIHENVDRIVFTLTCKRWFNERHKYLSFNTDIIKEIITKKEIDDSFLNSYKSIYIDSINRKNNYHLFASYGNSTDYYIELNKLPLIYNSIRISLPQEHSYFEEIYRLIPLSNITTLKKCQTLRYRLPENLTSISFFQKFNEPLLPGYLPANLKILSFKYTIFNQPIKVGILPNILEKLILDRGFRQPLEPGVLPTSLKYLTYHGIFFKVESLPPNLEVFKYYGRSLLKENDVLPMTLHTLTAPSSWLPAIKSLPNLKSLSLTFSHYDDETIDLGYLPSSLTQLEIEKGRYISTMPPSIKRLDLLHAEYDIDEIFKDRSQYQFDYLLNMLTEDYNM
ncbi:hypothetical protein PPL_09430 [Heterostelium album PN500]|uniref:F-box domain-containing protein n=1 Tax=Heterostelium pallidum (strain ATCC 26659 / Pp 5 / PN500) TaxID=670386 RepID=D3BPG2_HETP5|nr:hypothetical protein PPL_09430 [Heterostelium album PN500]EFA76680.1 hypothetical protein PPL_09430 [Heterostelium album PN500]|eukprot:XP_020428812.1 hypothetical protein PPL_09430 [Heterostelium album PN500]